MFEPKFKIGDFVQAKEYGIEKAVVLGSKIYYESSNLIDRTVIDSVETYLEKSNNCDYEIIYDDREDSSVTETFSERFLEAYEKE